MKCPIRSSTFSTLEEVAELNEDEWKDMRDETAEESLWLVGGFNTEMPPRRRKR